MPNKHNMRKAYYQKMTEWKKKYSKEESKKIDLSREKAIRNYEMAKLDSPTLQIDSQR